MAHVLIMPRQGNTVESCIITGWKVKEGDIVTPETMVCEVETDKAAFEVPAGQAGTVLKLIHSSGDDVPVLQPIAIIGAPGEDWQTALSGNVSRGDAEAQRNINRATGIPKKEISSLENKEALGKDLSSLRASAPPRELPSGKASPRARKLAAKEALSLEKVSGTGPGGRIIERDVIEALQNRPPLTAAAKATGPGTVPAAGTGIGGRVSVADMAANADLAAGASLASASSDAAMPPLRSLLATEGAITETPIKGIRKVISDRMFKSLAESAQFTLNSSASAVKLQELRSKIKTQGAFAEEQGISKISINDLILFAVSRILPRFPFMNAHKIGDTIRTFERVHLAVAVDTPRGLMVPVIRNANMLSLAQISSEAKRLAAACQNGSAKPDELSGSTFTVTNLGSLGITSFTPVLNTPEVGILGVCGIEMKPIALPAEEANECNCGVRFEPHIGFSLTINHQAVDGAPAAKFLKELADAVAQIVLLLATG